MGGDGMMCANCGMGSPASVWKEVQACPSCGHGGSVTPLGYFKECFVEAYGERRVLAHDGSMTYEYVADMLGKGLRGRLRYHLKKRQIMNDDYFLRVDARMIASGIGKRWEDGRRVWNVWVAPGLLARDDGFLRLAEKDFEEWRCEVCSLKKSGKA